jgi:hypothetical protein
MKISVDVYSQDIDASLKAFKHALDTGASDVNLASNHDWDTKKWESLNLRFEADHNNEALASLDDGPFQKDSEF